MRPRWWRRCGGDAHYRNSPQSCCKIQMCFDCIFSLSSSSWPTRNTVIYFLIISFLRSPPWCRGGALDLWTKGQRFVPRRRQLEKVVNLDENSWTPTEIIKKRSFSEAQKHWRGWDDNACLGVRNTSSIGVWHNSLDRRPPWYCIVSPLLQNKNKKIISFGKQTFSGISFRRQTF